MPFIIIMEGFDFIYARICAMQLSASVLVLSILEKI